jgi:hypothetical protein
LYTPQPGSSVFELLRVLRVLRNVGASAEETEITETFNTETRRSRGFLH